MQESNLMNAYEEAYRIACEKLNECSIQEVCQNSNAVYEIETKAYILKYLGAEYRIDCASGAVSLKDASGEATTTEKVLMLHYLIHSETRPLTGRHISFMEVPAGGSIYFSTFKKRAIDPLVKSFANDLPAFERAAAALAGTDEKLGAASFTIYAFPLVPITYVLWLGDDEVAPSGTILFDASVIHYLPVEDIVLAASFGVYKLMALKMKTK